MATYKKNSTKLLSMIEDDNNSTVFYTEFDGMYDVGDTLYICVKDDTAVNLKLDSLTLLKGYKLLKKKGNRLTLDIKYNELGLISLTDNTCYIGRAYINNTTILKGNINDTIMSDSLIKPTVKNDINLIQTIILSVKTEYSQKNINNIDYKSKYTNTDKILKSVIIDNKVESYYTYNNDGYGISFINLSNDYVTITNSNMDSGIFSKCILQGNSDIDRGIINNGIFNYCDITYYNINDGSFVNSILNINNTWNYGKWLNNIVDSNIYFKPLVWNDGIWNDGTFPITASWNNGIFVNGLFTGIEWINGEFQSGTFSGSTWNDGVFNDGEFTNSQWIDGSFYFGKFYDSMWTGGTFYNGTMYSTNQSSPLEWKTGKVYNGSFLYVKWNDGEVIYGEFYKCEWKNGIFNDGQLLECKWENGEFFNGIIKGNVSIGDVDFENKWLTGIFHMGTMINMKWENGVVFNGVFNNVIWNLGVWYNGTAIDTIFKKVDWYNGIFDSTTPTDGVFENGTWYNGMWNNGIFGVDGDGFDAIWENGNFYNGTYNGDIWKNGLFYSGKIEDDKYIPDRYIVNKPYEPYRISKTRNFPETKKKVKLSNVLKSLKTVPTAQPSSYGFRF